MNRPASPSTVVSIDLGPLADRARAKVAAGEYESLDSLIRAALVALDERESDFTEDELDRFAEEATAEFDASDGTTYTAEEVFGPILDRARQRLQGEDELDALAEHAVERDPGNAATYTAEEVRAYLKAEIEASHPA